MSIQIANAPVTWGIWGKASLPENRTPEDILSAVSKAGYDGIELGPAGFFGNAAATATALKDHSLLNAGMYVPLRVFEGEQTLEDDLAAVAKVADTVATVGPTGPVILAEETLPEIKRNLARGRGPSPLDLSSEQWTKLVQTFTQAQRIIESRGLTASFHPHTGTHIEQPWEVDRLLENTPLGLTLDTGHAAAGGDDPLDLLQRWSSRLNHVHIKDVHQSPIDEARTQHHEFGIAAAATALAGDLDLTRFLERLLQTGYDGWLVVEQDRRPDSGHDHAAVDEEQQRNLDWLRTTLATLGKTLS
jgi:inosose dehydratase